ncbi:unnamed protein product [Lathyrus sativus]|nr:unnamed protein product [Lathyrus sativus]
MVVVSIASNATSISHHLSMNDFVILKRFKVIVHALNILEVLWQLPPKNWIKLTYDGASKFLSNLLACGGIARYMIASNLGVADSLIAELSSARIVIEFAHEKNWNNV